MFDSPWHWLVVAAVAFVLFFGWKQLPDMSRSLGRSLRIFKTEIKGMSQDDQARADAEDAQADRTSQPGNAAPRELEAPANGTPLPRAEVVHNRPRPTPGGTPAATPQTGSQGSTSAR